MSHTTNPLDVPDPSDWLRSELPKLATVESALRCQELRLRRNWTVQEITDAFQAARSSLSLLAQRDLCETKTRKIGRKRKVVDTDFEDDDPEHQSTANRRKTRSQSRQGLENQQHAVAESSPNSDVPLRSKSSPASDGLAACPICGQRMKEESVFLHLDTHNETSGTKRPVSSRHKRSPSITVIAEPRPKVKPPERLPQMNYSLLKDNALRKKLLELGIPNTGPRALLIRRHAEWVNIVNANADSSRPKTKREMLRELDTWDRSTGRSITNSSSDQSITGAIMNKQFDGTAWSLNHNANFQDLISKARQTNISPHKSPIHNESPPESNAEAVDLPTRSVLLNGKSPNELPSPGVSDPIVILNSPSAV
ncbi:MAG: hypothetical protein Q9218_002304 [Villophora microphyllina]